MSSPPPTTLANARSCCPNTRIVCSRSAPLRQVTGEGDAAVCTVAYISRMNTRSTLLAALVFLALAPAALADKIPLADLSAYLNGLTTADTQFTQVNADGSVATGKLFLQRPGRARFEYAPPDKSLVLASGGQVAIFDAKSNQPPEQYPLARTPLNLILARNIDLARAKMVVAHLEDKTTTQVVVQDPDHPEYGTITLVFTANPVALRQWVISDDLGQQTTVILGDMHKGATYGASLFSINFEAQKRGL